MDMRRFRLFVRLLWMYQRSGLRWLARRLGVLRVFGLDEADTLLPDIPARFLSPHGETYRSTAGTNVAFFAGCVMSTALADLDRATIRVLQRAGYTVNNPSRQGCCGALHAHGGDLKRALELSKANIEAFEGTEGDIVVNSAGCGAMLKDYAHHHRNDRDWSARATAFSARVRDLTEILAPDDLDVARPLDATVVYQDACHLLHAQRISRQPRDLLRRIPGTKLVEIGEAGLCCGSAGVYNLTNPRQSRELRDRKLQNITAVEPTLVVTANPGCLLQLRNGSVAVKHIAEVLDDATAS
jgi:glycolate oxidase iron-sulfur subunit